MCSKTLINSVLVRAPLPGKGWRPIDRAIAPHCILYTAMYTIHLIISLQFTEVCTALYIIHSTVSVQFSALCNVLYAIHCTVIVKLCFRSFCIKSVGKYLIRDYTQPLESVPIIAKMPLHLTVYQNFLQVQCGQ